MNEPTLFHVPHPNRSEAALRDAVAAELRSMGKRVEIEVQCPAGGRVDIAVYGDGSEPVELIEVKRSNPISGLGQILHYGEGWTTRPHLVVLVPPYPITDSEAVRRIFKRCRVELRLCEPDPVRAWDSRHQGRLQKIAALEAEIKSINEEIEQIRNNARENIHWGQHRIIVKQGEITELRQADHEDHPSLDTDDLAALRHRRVMAAIVSRR